MCISPNTLIDGSKTACHKCWQCQEQAINDWVGRNIAESKTAVATNAVTLTYGRSEENAVDHLHSAILTYSDVQKYLKLLRRHGYPVRYFVAGEYGTKNGRAHWHIILHWQDKVPEHEFKVHAMEQHWPHGHSYWDDSSPAATKYVCKYILKDMGDDARQGHLAMSKKPPLGALYFEKLADQFVEQGLAPQTLEYTFQESRRRKQDGSYETIPYRLKDRSAEIYLRRYVDTWASQRPEQKIPKSELVELFLSPAPDDRDRIRTRLAELGPPSGWTPAQRVQVNYDLARLDQLEWADKRASLLDENAAKKTKAPYWVALEQWERKYFGGQEQQQRQEEQRAVQQRAEAVIADVHARQGRVRQQAQDGSIAYVHPQDAHAERAGPRQGRLGPALRSNAGLCK